MSTTTIRLEQDLKTRIAVVAERAGKSAHSFILDAIAETVERAETDEQFSRLADERWNRFLATGMSVPGDEVKAWLEARARGEDAPKPQARQFRA